MKPDAPRLKRRAFLRGCAAAAALGLGGGLWRTSGYPEAPAGLRVLSAREAHLVGQLTKVVCASDRLPPPSTAAIVTAVDAYLFGLPEPILELIGLLFASLEQAPLLDGFASRFSFLPEADAASVLAAWQHSGLALFRNGFAGVKTLIYAAYYSIPEVYQAIGFGGPLVPPGYEVAGSESYRALVAPAGRHPEDQA